MQGCWANKGLYTFWSFTLGKRKGYLKGVVAAIFHHMGHGALVDTISAVRNKNGFFGIAVGMYVPRKFVYCSNKGALTQDSLVG